MNQIVVNEPNKWRLETPGSAGWRPSPRPGAARKNFMMSADCHANGEPLGRAHEMGGDEQARSKAGADPKLPGGDRLSMLSVSGIDLDIVERGRGRPLLFLHAGEGLSPDRPWLDRLAQHFRVIAPVHPGWGRSALPDWMSSVDDIAYLYLDLSKQLDLKDAVLVGNCFGGWIAAEMAVRDTRRFAKLVLAAPLGAKFGGLHDRDIADMHGMARAEVEQLAWADPSRGAIDYTKMPEIELAGIVRGREAFTLFGWKPYMHNPKLKRWLHRIDMPTLLLWGERDRIITPVIGEQWRNAVAGASLETIADAGHFPQWEQPQVFADRIAAFART